MTPDPRPIWQIVHECVKANGGRATVKAMSDYLTERGRNGKNAWYDAISLSVNENSRVHYSGGHEPHRSDSGNRYDLLFHEKGGTFVLYEPEKHGLWEVYKRQDGTRAVRLVEEANTVTAGEPESELEQPQDPGLSEVASSSATSDLSSKFGAESHLRDYLAQNLEIIQGLGTTLRLYHDPDGSAVGVEYQTNVGRIDILARGDNGSFYVLELKLAHGPDAAVGQTLRYMAAVRNTLAKGHPVFGVIVASEISARLRYAVSEVRDRVFLLRYELQVSLASVEAVP